MVSLLTPLDIVALTWFFISWVGYTLIADSERLKHISVMGIMDEHRSRWMTEMLQRDMRMLDALILNHLQSGIAMFASTSILAVGGLVASLGATEKAIAVLSSLPLIGETSRMEWELKILLLLLIFVFAFFKFVWAYRLNTYCAVLVGAVPGSANIDTNAEDQAERAGKIANLASRHFNRGLRAFYFALAALAWVVHPVAFIITTTWVTVVLYRRDFRSRSQQIIRGIS